MKGLISVIIPSRNERFLYKTIKDLLTKATEEIEIIPILDGYWLSPKEIVDDPRVKYIHFSKSRGMRNAINSGARIAKGEFLMKLDAHCMLKEGFDEILKADCKDDWVVIPKRKRLEPETWTLRDVKKPDMDYMFLTYPNSDEAWGGREFSGREWREKNSDPELKAKLIDDAMSFQGSCWFMKKKYFDWLELMDEDNYGKFYKEAQEIGLKCWLSGGRVIRNKKTWYAHLHKGKKYGRGYHLSKGQDCNVYMRRWLRGKVWHKQKYKLRHLIEHFWPVPTWPEDYLEGKC